MDTYEPQSNHKIKKMQKIERNLIRTLEKANELKRDQKKKRTEKQKQNKAPKICCTIPNNLTGV